MNFDGRTIYDLYCTAMSQLPREVTRGEALPAFDFLDDVLLDAWDTFAELVREEFGA